MVSNSYLKERCQDRHFVVVGTPEGPTLIQVDRERVVPEHGHRFVVVPIHVARQEVEDGQVGQVGQTAAVLERRHFAHFVAVVVV